MTIRIAVVDGHALTRRGLAALDPDVRLVGETALAAEAPGLVASAKPDVVTIDVALEDGDGLALARALRDRYPALGIVVLTANNQDDVLFRALDTGASAFVEKTAPLGEVLGAIRHASVAATSFTATGLPGALARRGARTTLSPREQEVLTLLSSGMSIPAIATAIYISQSTAKTYVSRLYEKLGASTRAQALMTAFKSGLLPQS